MATSKGKKNHRKRVIARNNRIATEKAHAQKLQREFIMNLIKQEQEKGLFDNTTNINGPSIDGSEGPVIEGPVI